VLTRSRCQSPRIQEKSRCETEATSDGTSNRATNKSNEACDAFGGGKGSVKSAADRAEAKAAKTAKAAKKTAGELAEAGLYPNPKP
jgi:hypothetical protein